jgi:2-dehydropantoate 2-reductase
MGAGAVGSYFGGMLARAGVSVTWIGRRDHVEAIRRDRLFLDRLTFQERVGVEASTDPAAVAGADVVLFCVKGVEQRGGLALHRTALGCQRHRREFAKRRGQC